MNLDKFQIELNKAKIDFNERDKKLIKGLQILVLREYSTYNRVIKYFRYICFKKNL